MHCEYIGMPTGAAATPNTADVKGFQLVNSAAQKATSVSAGKKNEKWSATMKHALVEVAHELEPYARGTVRMIGAAGMTAAGRALAGGGARQLLQLAPMMLGV